MQDTLKVTLSLNKLSSTHVQMLSAFPTFIWRVIYFLCFFFAAGFVFFGFLILCFPAVLLSWFFFSCFSAFHASLLLCFTCFFSFLLLCFPCFSAFLLFAFPALLCFSAFCFSCFSAFPCFSASLLYLLLCFSDFFCFCASVPFYFYYSIFSFLQSCVFAALLPAPLLLCFLSLLPPCFCSLLLLYFLLFVS